MKDWDSLQYLKYKKESYGYSCLTNQKQYYTENYPNIVIENGHIDDAFRMKYVEDHLKYVHEAILDGVEVMGYLYWGPIDVVSAGTGEMKKRYGFVYVDRFNDGHGTLERHIKNSYYRYKEIIESNGDILL